MESMNADIRAEWWRPEISAKADSRWKAAAPPEATTAGVFPFRALLAFTFILVISPQSLFPSLAPLRIALVAAVTAIVTYLWDRFERRRPISIRTREIHLVALLAAWALITAPFSYWPGGSISFLFDVYLKSVAIFGLLCNTIDSEERLRKVLWTLSLMSLPLAATAAWNFHAGAFMPGGSTGDVVRIQGYTAPLTTNPNDLALMLNLILPLSVALLVSSRNFASRALLAATIVLSILAVLLTFSRGGFLTLAATALTGLVRRMKGIAAIGAGAALLTALLCLPYVSSVYVDHLRTIADIRTDATGSAQERLDDMLSAARYVALHPILGAGAGMNTLALNDLRGAEWRMVHNVYLECGADLGLPGLLLFTLLLVASIRSARRAAGAAAATPGMEKISVFAEGIATSLIGFAVAAMFHPVSYHFYFYYIAALAVAVHGISAARIREGSGA